MRKKFRAVDNYTDSENRALARLSAIAKHLARDHRKRLLALKQESKKLQRPDFIWEELLRTMSVMGNSRGQTGLMTNPTLRDAVSYGRLVKRSRRKRLRVLQSTLLRAKVRYARKKASWLAEDFEIIRDEKGPRAFTKRLLSQPGKSGKIRFLRKLRGIGEQNARNIMMSVYHPDFRDSIKVDLRIKKVSERLGLRGELSNQEKFYCRAARKAGLLAWELDRLLYTFTDEFLSRLDY